MKTFYIEKLDKHRFSLLKAKIENDNFKNRKSYKQQIAKKGFDIRLEANKLVTKYEELEKRIYKNNCNKKY